MPTIVSQYPATFTLSNLNGQTGVQFIGENLSDQSGYSVSYAGDVNNDGIDDFIIGARGALSGAGASYLVFGNTGSWMTPFSLSSLNGNNGVKFTGNTGGDYSGSSVYSAGDVNRDGITDIIIGAPNANNNAGASYLIFGQKGTWASPFNLSSLNGINGVEFTGENAPDHSGFDVSSAGDVNGDGIDDFMIATGNPNANHNTPTGYIIFGHLGTWSSPVSLSNLNGINGVKFIGSTITSCAVSSAGDVNDDGITDVIFGGGYSANSFSYLVFGHSGSWTTPFSLSALNGSNGVEVVSEPTYSDSGYSVSFAGDVNGDNIADFILGAPSSGGGANYVVFGHTGGWTTPLSLSSLNGANGIKFVGSSAESSGCAVSSAGDFNNDGITDLIIGAINSANNGVRVSGTGDGASYLIFGRTGTWALPFALSSLNGINGLKFIGNSGENNGYSLRYPLILNNP